MGLAIRIDSFLITAAAAVVYRGFIKTASVFYHRLSKNASVHFFRLSAQKMEETFSKFPLFFRQSMVE